LGQVEETVVKLQLGSVITPDMFGKVIQVIDANQMLVGVEKGHRASEGKGQYRTLFMLKCPTVGIVDDHFFGADWKKLSGSDSLKVTDTMTYKTTVGGSRTVFVVESTKPDLTATDRAAAKDDAERDPLRDDIISAAVKVEEMMKQKKLPETVKQATREYLLSGTSFPTSVSAQLKMTLIESAEVKAWVAATVKFKTAGNLK